METTPPPAPKKAEKEPEARPTRNKERKDAGSLLSGGSRITSYNVCYTKLLRYDLDRSLYQNLQSTRTMLVFIMAIIILVAGVNISSSLLNLVMEKQEQIAVLKSMGVGPGAIRRQFLVTGFT